jgi:hypothetical protein
MSEPVFLVTYLVTGVMIGLYLGVCLAYRFERRQEPVPVAVPMSTVATEGDPEIAVSERTEWVVVINPS